MSSNQSSNQSSNTPSFSGNNMPIRINPRGLDEGSDETTRRLAFQPSFESVSSFQPPSLNVVTETRASATSKDAPAWSGSPEHASQQISQQVSQQVSLQGSSLQESSLQGSSLQGSSLQGSHVVSQQTSLSQKDTQTGPSGGFWKLKVVPTLPDFHSLERTAVFCPYTSPSEVAERISDILRERSIQAVYENSKAKCVTAEGVDFRIRLYRGRQRFDHGIIVEVQRRFGASHVFYNDVTALLDAAQGKVPPPPASSESANLPLIGHDAQEADLSGSSSLGIVSNMISNSAFDSQSLALKMLVSLTDANKMGVSTAKNVSREIVETENTVRKNILALVKQDPVDPTDAHQLRDLAFFVVANVAQSLEGAFPLEDIREVVIVELLKANETPRLALQAARVAEFLTHSTQLDAALETALAAGKERHAALEAQAQKCLDKFR